jgi:hypothetical protein
MPSPQRRPSFSRTSPDDDLTGKGTLSHYSASASGMPEMGLLVVDSDGLTHGFPYSSLTYFTSLEKQLIICFSTHEVTCEWHGKDDQRTIDERVAVVESLRANLLTQLRADEEATFTVRVAEVKDDEDERG